MGTDKMQLKAEAPCQPHPTPGDGWAQCDDGGSVASDGSTDIHVCFCHSLSRGVNDSWVSGLAVACGYPAEPHFSSAGQPYGGCGWEVSL